MAKFNEYPVKTTPKDADKFMLYSAEDAANKLIDYDKLADAVLNKLTSKIFTLDQGNITLIEALNKLNSNAPFSLTAPNEVYIVNNKSFKVGRVVYIFAKVKITSELTLENILNFTDVAKNQSATFLIGKGSEWNINSVVYGYLGGSAILINNSQHAISVGDFLHINTVLIL